jgi:phospho-N-acetylmuramoyl-pentapeptide-transferase
VLYHLFHALLHGQHYAYENPLFRAVCAAICAGLFVILVAPVVIRQLVRLKIGDRPEFDHASLNELMKQKSNVPTMGGVIILAGTLLAIGLFADVTNFYVLMGVFCLIWLGSLGAVDDWLKLTRLRRGTTRDGLKSYEKILFQAGLGVLLGAFIYRYGETNFAPVSDGIQMGEKAIESYRILTVPFYKPGLLLSPLIFMCITVVVMTFSSNAVNLTDGMDGLASGCVVLSALVFMLLCDAAGDPAVARKLLIPYVAKSGELAVVCGAILGAAAGFLWHNCHPARVFMGDTGSLPLGGVLGYVAIVTRQELMLLIVGGVFLVEACSVMIQVGYFKMSGGKRVFRCAPIHHHFHLGGWTETQTVVRFWLIAAMCAGLAMASLKMR